PPARRPGETRTRAEATNGGQDVSIRPRPGGRGKPKCPQAILSDPRFQSAPGPEAGGNTTAAAHTYSRRSFNPPPARRPGETRSSRRSSAAARFQSAPGPEAGGNAT